MLKHKDLLGTEIANFTVNEVISCGSAVQSEFCLPVNQLPELHRDELIDALLQYFPIMLVTKEKISVLLDFEELSLNKDAFNLHFTGGDASSNEIALADDHDDSAEKDDLEQEIGFIGPWKRPGRTPLYIKFPSLTDCAAKFIKEHSFSAHVRRRETTGTGRGVTLKDIQEHLLENISGLKESGGISRDTIHVMTVAPRKNHTKTKRYKRLIDARVAGKRNQYRKENPFCACEIPRRICRKVQ